MLIRLLILFSTQSSSWLFTRSVNSSAVAVEVFSFSFIMFIFLFPFSTVLNCLSPLSHSLLSLSLSVFIILVRKKWQGKTGQLRTFWKSYLISGVFLTRNAIVLFLIRFLYSFISSNLNPGSCWTQGCGKKLLVRNSSSFHVQQKYRIFLGNSSLRLANDFIFQNLHIFFFNELNQLLRQVCSIQFNIRHQSLNLAKS